MLQNVAIYIFSAIDANIFLAHPARAIGIGLALLAHSVLAKAGCAVGVVLALGASVGQALARSTAVRIHGALFAHAFRGANGSGRTVGVGFARDANVAVAHLKRNT